MCGADVRKQRKGRDSSSTYQVGARLPVNKLLADICRVKFCAGWVRPLDEATFSYQDIIKCSHIRIQ